MIPRYTQNFNDPIHILERDDTERITRFEDFDKTQSFII